MADYDTKSVTEKFKTVNNHPFMIVTGAFLSLLAVAILISSFGAFFKPISAQFGWERAEVSLAASIASLFSGFVCIIAGRLSDKFSPRLITTIVSGIGGVAYIMLSQMNELWHLYFGYGILVGISMSNIIPVASLVARCFEKHRGLLMGITFSGGGVGAMISPPIITKLIDVFDWRMTYLIAGIAALTLIIISALCLRDPVHTRLTSDPKNVLPSERKLTGQEINLTWSIRQGIFWVFVGILLCATFAQQLVYIHIIPHATDLGILPIVAASVLSIIHGGGSAGSFIAGRIIDIIGSRLTLIVGVLVMLLALLLLLIADQAWIFVIFAVLFGIAIGMITPLRFTLVAEIFGLNAHGSITGAMYLISGIGGALSPLLAGYLFDVGGGYQVGFLIIIGTSVIGLVMAIFLKFRTTKYIARIKGVNK